MSRIPKKRSLLSGKLNGGGSQDFICRLDSENTKLIEKYLVIKGYTFTRWVKEVLASESSKIEKMIQSADPTH